MAPAITQPQTLGSAGGSVAAGISIIGNLPFGNYGYPAYGVLLAPAGLGAVSLYNAGFIDAAGTNPAGFEAGILLAGGGWFGNAGVIEATGTAKIGYAVAALAPATIANSGSVLGLGGIYAASGAVSNSGFIDVSADGINLASGQITNSGTIISTIITRGAENAAAIGNNAGAGFISVNNTGLAAGGYFGVALSGAGSISNGGTISARVLFGDGVLLAAGGTVTNGGVITGGNAGIIAAAGVAAIFNSGTISATTPARQFHPDLGTGVGLYSTVANELSNSAAGVIEGASDGLRTGGAATTIINAGTIAGAVDAISFAAGFANRLVVEPGAVFAGLVDGGNLLGAAVGSVLEFSGTTPGTIANFNAGFADFATIIVDPGARWTLNDITLAPQQTIITSDNVSIALAGTVENFIFTPVPCFAAGTRILTTRGERPVEDLRVGEFVITQGGEAAPIIWIGRRRIDLSRHPHAERVRPVRIAAGAMAELVPWRDLALSPDHAVSFENHLIPAKLLVNGRNVVQERRRVVSYYHIELAAHDVIFAENVAVESYLETGNRGCFENAPVVDLHGDFGAAAFQALREAKSCLPLAEDGPVVERLRGILLRRAFRAGCARVS